jgi:signal transduction histidine kinase/ligand-binding sensor domain-containing protein/CheY-like chemotaxis protein
MKYFQMKIIILFSALLFNDLYCSSQLDIKAFRSLTTEMGLSHGDIFSFYQDHDGYVWIGTQDGLNKYDGIGFTVYKFNHKDSTSLSSSYVNCIYEDKQNNLWIGVLNGLCKYNRDKDNFERITYNDNHNIKFGNLVNVILADNSNRLWVGTFNGLFLLDLEKKRFTTCFEDTYGKEILTSCSDMCQDKNGILWISFKDAVNGGLLKYNPETKAITRYNTRHPEIKLKENSINCLIVDNQNNIWIGYNSNGIDVLNGQTNTIISYQNVINNHNSLCNNNIFSMAYSKDGKILIGTNGGGLNVFDPSTKKFYLYTASESDPSLLSNDIRRLYISRDGIVWIGCWGGGVSIYDKRFDRFTLYRQVKQDKNSLDGSAVTCFAQDLNGNIWVSTDGGGISLFNPSKRNFTRHRSDSKNPQTLTNDKVLALNEDNKGGLWAGMWQGGLNYFKIDGEKLILKKKYDFVDENDSSSNCIYNIYLSENNELWIGNYSTGAYKYDPYTEKFKSIKFPAGINTFNTIKDIFCDSYNDVWFASDFNGLIRLNLESGEFDRFIHDEKDSTSLISNSINVVFEDSKKRLWIGIDDGGLNLFNRNTKSFTHYTTEQGLPDNTIVGILEDEHGNLWISSHVGISKATIDSTNSAGGKLNLIFRNYTVQDGLQGKVFNRWAHLKSKTGEMYFGGLNGFNVFHPDSMKDNDFMPPVHFTDFLLFNKAVIIGAKNSPLKKHISQTNELVLNHNQSFFTFRFVVLNYIFSEKNQYAYIMQGFDKDWNYIGNKREATYTNLEPGKYTFTVKACNNDGIWNETGTSIKIIILPPWWKTIWFKIALGISLFSAAFSIYRIRINKLKFEQQLLESKIIKRTNELSEVNIQLEEKQEEITIQNDELSKHRNHLEKLVNERTLELESAMKKAEESDKLKSAFLANMSHEIRTPMNAIIGFSTLLCDDELDKKEKENFVDIIVRNGESLLVLIDDILDLSRIQAGQLVLSYKDTLLDDLLNELYETFSLETHKYNLELKLQKIAITANFWIETDALRLKQVFSNLISNAIKYTEAGIIEFGVAEKQPNRIVFYVKDTGIGILPDIGDTIFENFLKIENDRAKVSGGAGLGLAISKKLIDLIGGEIWYESTLNIGTTFFFSIPLIIVDEKNKPVPKEDDQIVQIPDLSDKTILVAEDEEYNYKLIAAFLKKTKAHTVWAKNGIEAIELCKQNPTVDLVLMDIKMPLMDGIEANKKIKTFRSDLKVVAQTAFAYENDIREFLASGFDASLTKPIKINELMNVLKQLLG